MLIPITITPYLPTITAPKTNAPTFGTRQMCQETCWLILLIGDTTITTTVTPQQAHNNHTNIGQIMAKVAVNFNNDECLTTNQNASRMDPDRMNIRVHQIRIPLLVV
eukprot:1030330_1